MLLANEEEGWSATVSVVKDMKFEDFKNNIDELDEMFLSTSGITVTNVDIKISWLRYNNTWERI